VPKSKPTKAGAASKVILFLSSSIDLQARHFHAYHASCRSCFYVRRSPTSALMQKALSCYSQSQKILCPLQAGPRSTKKTAEDAAGHAKSKAGPSRRTTGKQEQAP